MNGSPSVKVALFIRNGGSESPCRWFYVTGIYKKEQKLKKNLYKALTEYFIHNAKNSLASSKNILDQLASFRMETGLPAALRQDKKYQKAQKNCNKANEKMQDLNLTPQQWDTIDAAITAKNNASIESVSYTHLTLPTT